MTVRQLSIAGLLAAAAASSAHGQAAPGAVRFGQPGSPYDVTAEHQEIFQAENKVVLTGAVEVLNGQSRLRTPQLTVFYNKNNGVRGQSSLTGAPGAVQRMEAAGPVYFVTPTQNAKGDHASYDAATDTMTMAGHVTLVQDKNVATGEVLTINQKTGVVTLNGGGPKGRVRGVFYQDDKPGAAAAPKR